MKLQNNSIVYALLFLAGLVLPHTTYATDSSGTTYTNTDDFHISAYSYLVTPNSQTELPYIFANMFPGISQNHQPFSLSPSVQPREITANIAGQENDDLAILTKDRQHILALLDWPKGFDGPMMSIIARLDTKNPKIPSCYRPIDLINNERYYYPSWHLLKIMPSANGDYLIGAHASGSDSDGEGGGGWEMIAILKLTSTCELTLLHKEEDSWLSDYEEVNCYGSHLDFRFINDNSVEIVKIGHTCDYPKSKGKVTQKRIPLQERN